MKEPRVGKNIPTIAKMSQGEVIKFAGAAAEQMRMDGFNVRLPAEPPTPHSPRPHTHIRSCLRMDGFNVVRFRTPLPHTF